MSTPQKKLPLSAKLSYGLGGYAEHNLNNTINMMANPILNVTLGVSPALVGIVLAAPRFWDAFTDPIMGGVSDRWNSKYGRRKPFIFIGGMLSAMFFVIMWMMPRGMSEMQYFSYFLITSLLFYTCFTVFGVPYYALGFEMSSDYGERTEIQTYRSIFSFISGFAVQWMFWLIQRDVFSDSLEGMRWVAGGSSLIIVGCIILTVLYCTERTQDPVSQKKYSIMSSFVTTLSCRPFLLIIGVIVAVLFGILLVMQMALYINIWPCP
ncbi:MAG: MFS transporter [Planctomycetes bacterium]|nr:MFS transporter [Planctomycetota bacterium]